MTGEGRTQSVADLALGAAEVVTGVAVGDVARRAGLCGCVEVVSGDAAEAGA